MVIGQGDVAWIDLPPPSRSESAGRRPVVVLQHDRFNATRIATVVVVAITSQLKYEALPGNVRLRRGEAGLPKASVVNVTQISTIDRSRVVGKIGRLTLARLAQVWEGIRLVLEPGP